MTVRTLLLALVWMSVAWTFPIAAQTQGYSVDAPKHQVGDWYMRELNGKRFKLVINKIDENGNLYFYSGKNLGNVTNSDMNTLSRPFFWDGSWQRQTLSPHSHQYAFPLYVGKKWSAEYNWAIGAANGTISTSARVVSLVSVVIGGKTLEALRIDYEDRVTVNERRGPLERYTCLYVPAMKLAGQCGSSSTPNSKTNIVDYGLKDAPQAMK